MIRERDQLKAWRGIWTRDAKNQKYNMYWSRSTRESLFPTLRNSIVLIYLRSFNFYREPRSPQVHRSMCPMYDVPFRYFIPLNTYADAVPEHFLSLSRPLFLSHVEPLLHIRATPAWLLESVHSSLCSFSFRGISYGLLSNPATGSKYSFATNFHLHVFSPFGSLSLLRTRPSVFFRFHCE